MEDSEKEPEVPEVTEPTPQVNVKMEQSATPRGATPASTMASNSARGTPVPSTGAVNSKKRAAPKSTQAKKGTAQQVTKKRKVETSAESSPAPSKATSRSRKNATPASRTAARKSKAQQSTEPEEEETDDGQRYNKDGEEIYCVCKKEDDGSPMINCEGCQDWFHIRCIKVKETDIKIISNYFCEYLISLHDNFPKSPATRRVGKLSRDALEPH
jgi:PHD-finger